tara:strand:- start:73 stop:261 length:189 start_codon:yes stop_codon:yes gene_type:complete
MKNEQLTAEETAYLRSANLLEENEYAYKAGDLVIAENPMTGDKRIITRANVLKESNKRVLKG